MVPLCFTWTLKSPGPPGFVFICAIGQEPSSFSEWQADCTYMFSGRPFFPQRAARPSANYTRLGVGVWSALLICVLLFQWLSFCDRFLTSGWANSLPLGFFFGNKETSIFFKLICPHQWNLKSVWYINKRFWWNCGWVCTELTVWGLAICLLCTSQRGPVNPVSCLPAIPCSSPHICVI